MSALRWLSFFWVVWLPVSAAVAVEKVIPLPLESYATLSSPEGVSAGSDDRQTRTWLQAVQDMRAAGLARHAAIADGHDGDVRLSARHPAAAMPANELYLRAGGSPGFLRATRRAGQKVRGQLQSRSLVRLPDAASRSDVATARSFFRSYAQLLRLDNPVGELRMVNESPDQLHHHHLQYVQYYQGIPVWPSRLVVHTDADGQVRTLTGNFIPTPRQMDVHPRMTAAEAGKIAKAGFNASSQEIVTDLVIYAPADLPERLAWRCLLKRRGQERWWILVDAHNGHVLDRIRQNPQLAETGSGLDRSGKRAALDLWDQGGEYFMVNVAKPMYKGQGDPMAAGAKGVITVRDAHNTPPTRYPAGPVKSDIVSSRSPDAGWLADAVSAARNLSLVYDYFLQRHGRDSMDGQGSSVTAVVRYGKHYDNAYWDTRLSTMYFGDERAFSSALDVVGHEMTHGVIAHTADLLYTRQSGALSEAFADIFGEMVEAYANDGENDWINGGTLGSGFRHLRQPGLIKTAARKGYPASMKEYVKTTADEGGVHVNATIIGHAFYLLAEGLQGAIGRGDAEQIFYRALTQYLTPGSQFIDLRFACLQAAEDLFGADALQVKKVGQAFDAVGITEISALAGAGGASLTVVNGQDELVALTSEDSVSVPVRLDHELGDSAAGVPLAGVSAFGPGLSVIRDGSLMAYISESRDACTVPLDRQQTPVCLGLSGRVQNLVMAPDGRQMAMVLKDASGRITPSITVMTLAGKGSRRTFRLVAPSVLDGLSRITMTRANAMSFNADGRYLMFDAERSMVAANGAVSRSWSIYALDLTTGIMLDVIPPLAGKDIVNPSMSAIDPGLMLYEIRDQASPEIHVRMADLALGTVSEVIRLQAQGYPSFNGDDTAVVYAAPGPGAQAGYALWRQPLYDASGRRASLPASVLLPDARRGVIYRRARTQTMSTTLSGKGKGRIRSSLGEIDCGSRCSASFATGDTAHFQAIPDAGSQFSGWGGECSGQIQVGSADCRLAVFRSGTVSARFDLLPRYTLKLQKQGGGKGSLQVAALAINCSASCTRTGISADTVLSIRALPASGSQFSGWGGDCAGTQGDVCQISMDKARAVSAIFGKP